MRREHNRCLLLGSSAAGKTTLCQTIMNHPVCYRKTQMVQLFGENLIDTPGEYLERRYCRANVTVVAADANILLFVHDATNEDTMFPPAYASSFMKPVIGVITKCDLADEDEKNRARYYLRMAGVGEIFEVSSVTGEGIDDLMDRLGMKQAESELEHAPVAL